MIILIICQVIEDHPTIHFLHISKILSQETSQCQQVTIIQHRIRQ
ncbi:unknown [Bacteroides sp. CAG:714]|nr:unknown [Bacteroides sp. CAG:714]